MRDFKLILQKYMNCLRARFFATIANVDVVVPKRSRKVTETVVFTDGSCLNNGKSNAFAGVGVFFGANDKRYRFGSYLNAKES